MKKLIKIIITTLASIVIIIISSYFLMFNPSNIKNLKTIYTTPFSDLNFTILKNKNKKIGLREADRYVEVFGLNIYAAKTVPNYKVLHAANILAQYLDNDEDGVIDNQDVWNKLKAKKDILFMHPENKFSLNTIQNLTSEETVPEWHSDKTKRFDASIEEIWHVITTSGYSLVYSNELGEKAGSQLSQAMDIARGGHFKNIPNEYPTSAWYKYDDSTCNYNCMTSEYIYWLMTSKLGAHITRGNEVNNEWELTTIEKLKNQDELGWEIINNPKFKFPKNMPNGKYVPLIKES